MPRESRHADPAAETGAPPPLRSLLREARERADLSVRQLAARMHVSPATVLEAEAGGDPRGSTLVKYLEALPTLSASTLLGGIAPPAGATPAAWDFVRSVLGFSIGHLRFEVDLAAGEDGGQRVTSLVAEGVRPEGGSLADMSTRRLVVQLLVRGSHDARLEAGRRVSELDDSDLTIADGAFLHRFALSGKGTRATLTYRRIQSPSVALPPGAVAAGNLALAAPFPEGVSLAIEHAIERLELVVRVPLATRPETARPGAWSDLQTVTPERPDFLPRLHPAGLDFSLSRRAGTFTLAVDQPVFGLYYGIGWGGEASVPAKSAVAHGGLELPGAAIRAAREGAGLSQRELAARITVSPATVALAERGQDLRRSHVVRLLAELPSLTPESLLPAGVARVPLTRREAWEHWRQLLGIEADEERKTLVITAEGDAHAVCETLRLRRVRPGGRDMRVRYSSVQALGRRLPTVLKAIEEAVAAEAQDSGLRARVVARREGRLIHEITVPAPLAQVGASYSRRLFNAGFFDPRADSPGPHHDGAAIVPFHPVRRLRLTVTLPPGRWPQHVVFGVHPRMMLDGPLEDADVAGRLHPEGLETTIDEATSTIQLCVDWPLVGFMYDVFWM